MSVRGRLLLAAMGLVCAASSQAAGPEFLTARASDDVRYAATRVLAAADNQNLPFAIVDKKGARIYVFDPAGRLVGDSAALIGVAIGDESIADIAARSPESLAPEERTTPAGRFISQPGHNDKGESIVWVDYAASIAIHRLRPAPALERRPARLASATADDNRISLGCVVVPVEFYTSVVAPTLGSRRAVVYVLPETRPVQTLFDAVELSLRDD